MKPRFPPKPPAPSVRVYFAPAIERARKLLPDESATNAEVIEDIAGSASCLSPRLTLCVTGLRATTRAVKNLSLRVDAGGGLSVRRRQRGRT